jgi:sialic acid synthase SpsE
MHLQIANQRVGAGEPCFVIAEAGSNHNGSLETARALIDVAAESGADAVKFQVFRAGRLYPRTAGTSDYLGVDRPIFDIIAEMETPYEWLPLLRGYCDERGVAFLASVFDEESADRVAPFVDVFKVASYEMTHLPLLRYLAATGKSVIMSTGTATLDEVGDSVRAFRDAGGAGLLLMQCTAAYPSPLEALNLRAMTAMAAAFNVPVGLSDHSRDPIIGPVAAVAVGACVIEKHFTLSNRMPGPDHRFAVEPDELRRLVAAVRDAERALGREGKHVHPVEEELRAFARRSIFAIRDVSEGEPFSRENVAVLRCGKNAPGLPPADFDRVLQTHARRAVREGAAITQADCV